MNKTTFREIILGGSFALITSDALGVPVEFMDRSQLRATPVTSMRGYGSHNQPSGTWSDDSSMMLAAMDSLTAKGYDPEDIMQHFTHWLRQQEYTPLGNVFDVGNTCRQAIAFWDMGNIPAVDCGGSSDNNNGNGSLMWILPVCYYADALERVASSLPVKVFPL